MSLFLFYIFVEKLDDVRLVGDVFRLVDLYFGRLVRIVVREREHNTYFGYNQPKKQSII